MGDIDQICSKLRKAIVPIEKSRTRARLDNHVPDSLAFVEEHQAGLICNGSDVITEFVCRVRNGVDPIAFPKVPRIDAAITDLSANRAN